MSTKPTTKKKILALLLSLAMVVTMIPLGVFGGNGSDTYKNYYKIAHLDCGRKYFSVDYIKGMIDTMYANGYNQLELAIGNGGLRLVLDDMDLTYGGKKLFYSNDVKNAIKEGNKNFYNDPNGNYLTEAQMDTIISYANARDIQIVPLLNMPGHMDGILSSSEFSQYKLSGSEGSLDLNNADAVEFGKALLTKYVEYFSSKGCNFFNFGADEYGQGIRNPYIESSEAKVTYNQLISYMNDCAKIIEDAKMTARAFNDFVCYNNRNSCNLYKTVEICYWSNQWNGSEYNTAKVIKNAGYKLINTNQKWYFVPSKASEYGKATVLSNFNTFDVTKFQNVTSDGNPTSTAYTEIPVGDSNKGSMFCVWCDEPSVDVAAGDVNELLKAFSDANPNYFTKTQAAPKSTVYNVSGNTDSSSNDTVKVTASGLTALICSEVNNVDVSAIKGVNKDRVLAYDITPSAGKEKYTGEGTVSIKIPESGWNTDKICAFIIENGKAEMIDAEIKDGWATFTAPHFSVMGIAELEYTAEERITVTVDKTATATQKNVNNAGTYTTENPDIATVSTEYRSVEGEVTPNKVTSITSGKGYYISDGNGNYLQLDGSTLKNTTDVKEATLWTFTSNDNSYTIKSGNYYLTCYNNGYGLYAVTTGQYLNWTIYNGIISDPWKYTTGIKYESNTGWSCKYDRDDYATGNGAPYTVTVTEPVDETAITFSGVAAGTTTVIIGGIKYIITVTEEDLTDKSLPINLWITNTGVVPTGWSNNSPSEFAYSDTAGNRRSIYILKANRGGVYSESGIELSSILPSKLGTATSYDSKTYNVRYWKSAYHTSETRQSTDGWTNNSHKGTTFKYIRYWNNSWAYSADGVSWTDIENVGAEAADTGKNQVNLWYRQKTEITEEVETEIVDWGPVSYEGGQCLLDFTVKYESGQRNPDDFPVPGKTMGFTWNDSTAKSNGYVTQDTDGTYYRTVYGIAGVETAEYEVYMITVTPSSNDHKTYINSSSTAATSYDYKGTEKVAWAKTEADATNSGLGIVDETTDHIKMSYGGEPFLESVKIYQYQGLLVTYYVRALDGLKVHYINENTNEEFYNYNISVKQGTVFNTGIKLDSPNWKKNLVNGSVENSKDITQTVSADLSTMPAIGAQYRYSDYTCTRVERKTDGKEVYLYYKFTNEKTYVVDYGLKLNIGLFDLNSNLTGSGVTIKSVEAVGAEYATLTVGENNSVEYKLNKMLSEQDTFTITVRGSLVGSSGEKVDTVTYNITVIPATTVYYEDDFGAISYSGEWVAVPDRTSETPDTAVQALDELGNSSNNYGYDPAYGNYKTYSMGSAHKATVSASKTSGPAATFTFKGTGFDVISLTDNTSGAITVSIYDEESNFIKKLIVINYYGYKYENGKWTAAPGNDNNALYQIPVMKVDMTKLGYGYGTYTVKIEPKYSKLFDFTGKSEYNFWLDAVRIYNPAGTNLDSSYAKDNEQSPSYKEIRDIILETKEFNAGDSEVTGAVFIDGKGSQGATIADYENYGPNNEVYLANGQAIAFKLVTDNKEAVKTVQIGAKLANGTSGTLYSNAFSATETTKTIGTATDMYYKLDMTKLNFKQSGTKYESYVITFKNNSGGIISLTNVKVTGGAKIVDNTAAATNNYVMLMASPAIAKEAADIMNNVPSSGGPSLPSVKPGSEDTQLPELPKIISVKADKSVIGKGSKAVIRITASENTEYITVNDELVKDYTVVEKNGVKYKVFTYKNTEKVKGNREYTVVAYGSDNLSGKQETAMVKVKVFKPGKFTVSVKAKKVKKNKKASLTVTTSKNTKYITVNGKKITKYTKKGKYKVWKYSKKYTKTGTKSFKVVAYDSKKIPSDTKKAVVKVVR